MAYTDILTRATPGTSPLISEVVQREIVSGALEKSAARQLMAVVDMGTAQTRIPVIASFPLAYFVTGASLAERDVGLKQTTAMTWDNVYLNAEEIAVIIPIPNNLIADTKYPLWNTIKPRAQEAVAIALDDAVFFGTNAPTTWPSGVVPAAVAASNQVIAGTSAVDVLDDINEVYRSVEDDGFEVTGVWARNQVRGKLRGLRSTTRELLFVPDSGTPANGISTGTLMGERVVFSKAGFSSFGTSASNYSLIAAQWDQFILGIRQDVQMQMFTEGVLTDAAGNVVLNLMQQDSSAMRITWRGGFAVPNPINRMNQTAATRYPAAVLKQRAATGGE